MHNLFGDRFLIMFAGDLQRRLKRTIPDVKDQNPDAITEGAAEPVYPASEEGYEANQTEGNHLLKEEEQNKMNDIERKVSENGKGEAWINAQHLC